MPSLSEVLSKVTAEEVVVDFDGYVDQSEFPPPAPEGVYTFKQVKSDFEVNKAGYLSAVLNHEVVAPGDPVDGHKINFDRVSSKPFERNGVKVSQMADHIRALGITERPKDPKAMGEAIASGDGQLWKGQTRWEAGCNHKDTEHEVEWGDSKVYRLVGMKKFPMLPNGQHQDTVTCPTCGAELRAQEKINRRIPQ